MSTTKTKVTKKSTRKKYTRLSKRDYDLKKLLAKDPFKLTDDERMFLHDHAHDLL